MADFVTFAVINNVKMGKRKYIIVFGGLLFVTILVVFFSCCFFSHIKNEQILRATYLFNHAIDREKVLMQPDFISFPKSTIGISSDVNIVETEKGKIVYQKNKKSDTLDLAHKREWMFQVVLTLKNPNRVFTLDSLFQEELKKEGVIAQTAVSFFQGGKYIDCSNKLLRQTGTALEPVVFGTDYDPRQIKLQAYVLFPYSFIFSKMYLLGAVILLWSISVIATCIWYRHQKIKDRLSTVCSEIPLLVEVLENTSEWVEIASGVIFNKVSGNLRNKNKEVSLKKNRLRAFSCLLEATDLTVSYSVFCREVLGRPLCEDESVEVNKVLNRSIKKSMTQTIQRLREDLRDFPEFSIENIMGEGYRLIIKN